MNTAWTNLIEKIYWGLKSINATMIFFFNVTILKKQKQVELLILVYRVGHAWLCHLRSTLHGGQGVSPWSADNPHEGADGWGQLPDGIQVNSLTPAQKK